MHKAAYVTFTPWYGKEELASTVSVTAIKLTIDAASNAGKNIAGTFNFDDSGLGTLHSNGTNSITLELTNGFPVPKAADYTKNAATMVVCPGTYNKVTIAYTLKDTKTGVTGIVSQTFPTMTFNAGKNRPIGKNELGMNNYKPNYYQWDAGKPYWDGYKGTIPVVNGEGGNYMPGSGSDRYMNSNLNAFEGNNSCASAPNVNEALLYSFCGETCWDGNLVWTMNKHLYKGGMWFQKLNKISSGGHTGFTHPVTNIYQWSNNYIPSSSNTYWNSWSEGDEGNVSAGAWTKDVTKQGKPTNIENYFFLPAMGYLNKNGMLVLGDNDKYGYYGSYWTSNGVNLGYQALSLHFNDKKVGVNVDVRLWAYPIFDAVTYQLK
jgi:putative lipoprotein